MAVTLLIHHGLWLKVCSILLSLNWCCGTNSHMDSASASNENMQAVVGAHLSAQVSHCFALPLHRGAGVPGRYQDLRLSSLMSCRSMLRFMMRIGAVSVPMDDLLPNVVPCNPCVYSGQFTDVRQLREKVWAICPEMQEFYLGVLDRAGCYSFNVQPFAPHAYFISVHPLVFTTTFSQMSLILQAICHSCHLYTSTPRYWLGRDNTMVLEEWGRWRSQYALEWPAVHGFAGVPPGIVTELIQLCQEAGVFNIDDTPFDFSCSLPRNKRAD